MKRVLKILIAVNLLLAVLLLISNFSGLYFYFSQLATEDPQVVGIVGGADGPTAIFLSREVTLLGFLWGLMFPTLLAVNAYVLYRLRRQFAPSTTPTP